MQQQKKKRIKLPITVTLPPDFIARIVEQKKQRKNLTASEIVRDALRVYYGIQPLSL
jgi:hypothetical protein